MILTKMKIAAEEHLGMPVNHAVITVPAYFTDAQRKATKDAGEIAGLKVLRILNEPIAAAIAYGLNKITTNELNILIFDWGGGTLDVSILILQTVNGDKTFEVKGIAGNPHLGGEDFDNNLVNYLLADIKKNHNMDFGNDKRVLSHLRSAAEQAKCSLSATKQTRITIDRLFQDTDYAITITKAKFEELNMELFNNAMLKVDEVIKTAKMEAENLHEVILVGGSSRIPKIQTMLQTYFKGKKLSKSINADEAVAKGAAIHAEFLSGQNDMPDNKHILVDVNPISLGVALVSGLMDVIIPRNTVIPTKRTRDYSSRESTAKSAVFQGENEMYAENSLLRVFELHNVQNVDGTNEPNIKITFEINENGILNVTAEDEGSQQNKMWVITNIKTVSSDEMQEKIAMEKWFKLQKAIQDELNEAKNNLEEFCNSVVSFLSGENANIDENVKNDILQKSKNDIDWLNENQKRSKMEYNARLQDLKAVCKPIIDKICPDEPAAGVDSSDDFADSLTMDLE